MDWNVFATIAAPIIALPIGAAINRAVEQRVKLVTFMSHAAAIPVRPEQGQAVTVNTHTVVVRNAGKVIATNVRLGHAVLPRDFGIWPAVNYELNRHDNGTAEIVFPQLIPAEQVTITYLYPPPLLWNQVNSYTKCDQGFAKILSVIPQQPPPKWAARVALLLMLIGAATVFYAVWQLLGAPLLAKLLS